MHSSLSSANFLHFKTKLLTLRETRVVLKRFLFHTGQWAFIQHYLAGIKKTTIQFHSLKKLKMHYLTLVKQNEWLLNWFQSRSLSLRKIVVLKCRLMIYSHQKRSKCQENEWNVFLLIKSTPYNTKRQRQKTQGFNKSTQTDKYVCIHLTSLEYILSNYYFCF